MTKKRLLFACAITGLVISLPFTGLHLAANPDDAPITPLQHVTAAWANFFGPWGVAIVRLVDFPNAGLRSFSWPLAVGLTALGILIIAICVRVKSRPLQYLMLACWALFAVAWFVVGLFQIADGLL